MLDPGPIDSLRQTSRRRFLTQAARAACGSAVAGLALGLAARPGATLAAPALRPPGARLEADFLGACIRCGLCVRDCPYDTLKLAHFGDELPVGSPYFVARDVPCEMCENIPCVAACPTGALDKGLTDIAQARMGTAVLVGHETCLNFLGLRCDVCYRVCPLIGQAITLERQHNTRTGKHAIFIPTVSSDRCTGCGKCEKACVLEAAAIKVLPREMATGQIGSHYRIGWREGQKGRPSVDTMRQLPPRMPGEGAPLNGAPGAGR